MQLLASAEHIGHDLKQGKREEMVVKVHENSMDDLGIAEVSVSGNFAANSGTKTNTFAKQKNIDYSENTSYWIPKLDIDEAGFATLEYKIENKNKLIYVNIQGLSENGLVGYRDFTIDPKDVEDRKK